MNFIDQSNSPKLAFMKICLLWVVILTALFFRMYFTYLADSREADFELRDNIFTAAVGLLNQKGFQAPDDMREKISEARSALEDYKRNTFRRTGKQNVLELSTSEYWRYFEFKSELLKKLYLRNCADSKWTFPLYVYTNRDIGAYYFPALFMIATNHYGLTYYLILLSLFDTLCVFILFFMVHRFTQNFGVALLSSLLYAVSPLIFPYWDLPQYPVLMHNALIICVAMFFCIEAERSFSTKGLLCLLIFSTFMTVATSLRVTIQAASYISILLLFLKALLSRRSTYLYYGISLLVMIIGFNLFWQYHAKGLLGDKQAYVSFVSKSDPKQTSGPSFFKMNSSLGNKKGMLAISDQQFYSAIKYKFPMLYQFSGIPDYMTNQAESILKSIGVNRIRDNPLQEVPNIIRKCAQTIYSILYFDVHSGGNREESDPPNYLYMSHGDVRPFMGHLWGIFSGLTILFLILYVLAIPVNGILLSSIFIRRDITCVEFMVVISLVYNFLFCMIIVSRPFYVAGPGMSMMVVTVPATTWLLWRDRKIFGNFFYSIYSRWKYAFCALAIGVAAVVIILAPIIYNDFKISKLSFIAGNVSKDRITRLNEAVNDLNTNEMSGNLVNNSFSIAQIYRYMLYEQRVTGLDLDDLKGRVNAKLAQAVQLQPDNPDLLFACGNEYFTQGNYVGAKAKYLNLIRIAPNYEFVDFVNRQLALIYYTEGNKYLSGLYQSKAEEGYIAQYLKWIRTLSDIADQRIVFIGNLASAVQSKDAQVKLLRSGLDNRDLPQYTLTEGGSLETCYFEFQKQNGDDVNIGMLFIVYDGLVKLQVLDGVGHAVLDVSRTPESSGCGLFNMKVKTRDQRLKVVITGQKSAKFSINGLWIVPQAWKSWALSGFNGV